MSSIFTRKSPQHCYRSYLSPESLKSHKLIQSPKFDVERAIQEQIERKRRNEEKLIRFNEYNAGLAAKGLRGVNRQRCEQKLQFNKRSIPVSPNGSRCNNIKQTKQSVLTIPQQETLVQAQQRNYLQLLRQTNKSLHGKNSDLKKYLGEITSGVTQLQTILKDVETNYHKLKNVNPEFQGLWLMNAHSQTHLNDSLSVNNSLSQKQQPHNLSQSHISSSQRNSITESLDSSSDIDRLKQIQKLQETFQNILTNIAKRSPIIGQKNNQINQLNALEKQVDRLKRQSSTLTLNNSKSLKNMHDFNPKDRYEDKNFNKLNKVTSLQRLK